MTNRDSSTNNTKPLAGFRIIEFAGIGPAPHCGQLLGDLGAQIILVERPMPPYPFIERRGKKSIILDLRKDQAVSAFLKLVKTSDAVIDGYRPGVTARLGVGPIECQKINPKLVYGHMTGWGQTGPWADMAGHDINYLSITGALHALGPADAPPSPPLNMIGDFGGGSVYLAMGILAALLKAQKTGQGDIIDGAIIDGVSSLMGTLLSLHALGQWSPKRGQNLLDGGAPFYRCYETADGKFMAVGSVEAKFFKILLERLNIDAAHYGDQNDRAQWPEQHKILESIFIKKSRQEWAKIFDKTDACVTPVLDYLEAIDHPHNNARAIHRKEGLYIHPPIAPRFSSMEEQDITPLASHGADTHTVLKEIGLDDEEIDILTTK